MILSVACGITYWHGMACRVVQCKQGSRVHAVLPERAAEASCWVEVARQVLWCVCVLGRGM